MEYNEILTLALEIEGLAILLQERGDEAPAEVASLIRAKAARLHALAGDEEAVETPVEAAEPPVVASMLFEEEEDALPDMPEEPEPKPEPEPLPVVAETKIPVTLGDMAAAAEARDMRRALSLNDRFRFRRELFAGRDDDLDEALDAVNHMSNLEEAEEYFYNDLCWDAESEEVREFMRLVAAHFGNN